MNAQEIRGHWQEIRGQVKEKWGQLTDDDLNIASGNVDQVIGRITQKTGEARASVEAFLDDLVNGGGSVLTKARDRATEYAQSATRAAQDGVDQVREYANEGYRQAGRMVQQRPAESMAVVFGIGFLTGLAVCLLVRRDA
jgi:uncharacterized protein YjbJ (UPF0337 family)